MKDTKQINLELVERMKEIENQRDELLAACKCAMERIQDGSMEQTNEYGQPTKRAMSISKDTILWLRKAIDGVEATNAR